jgi:hypothetical protein
MCCLLFLRLANAMIVFLQAPTLSNPQPFDKHMLDTNVVNPSFGGFIPPIFGEFWDGLSLS